ncbi:unnamed protein product [Thelazia callipaeda]|uniref:Uncharacterized protein n=1 Tax=Thelazia callipaeda TaxID=103827 RepID=A0A0N5D925_THECL|nr:unnamed protein product [Thelazia callipaeda]
MLYNALLGLTTKALRSIRKPAMNSRDGLPRAAIPNVRQNVSLSFDFTDESDNENFPTCDIRKKPQRAASIRGTSEAKVSKDSKKSSANDQKNYAKQSDASKIERALKGRMTPVEMLNNFGLERSLSATYTDNRSILELLPETKPTKEGQRIFCSDQMRTKKIARLKRITAFNINN